MHRLDEFRLAWIAALDALDEAFPGLHVPWTFIFSSLVVLAGSLKF